MMKHIFNYEDTRLMILLGNQNSIVSVVSRGEYEPKRYIGCEARYPPDTIITHVDENDYEL